MRALQVVEVRQALCLSQQAFSQLVGVHVMTVSRWERGELQPTPWQVSLLTAFKTAANHREVKQNLAQVLTCRGAVKAIHYLLERA